MRRFSFFLLFSVVSVTLAQDAPVGYADTPMLPNLPYRVHDAAHCDF